MAGWLKRVLQSTAPAPAAAPAASASASAAAAAGAAEAAAPKPVPTGYFPVRSRATPSYRDRVFHTPEPQPIWAPPKGSELHALVFDRGVDVTELPGTTPERTRLTDAVLRGADGADGGGGDEVLPKPLRALVCAYLPPSLPRGGMSLCTRTLAGKSVRIELAHWHATVGDLKAAVQDREGIPPDRQRLVFGGRQLEFDDDVLVGYGVGAGATAHLVLRLRAGANHTTHVTAVTDCPAAAAAIPLTTSTAMPTATTKASAPH